MLKVYGSDICGDCRNFKVVEQLRGFEVEHIDITASTRNMKDFLIFRDTDPIFDGVKERHAIGIPLFVREDGATTLDMDEALAWLGQPPVVPEELADLGEGCKKGECN